LQGINNNGVGVGYCLGPEDGIFHGFVLANGVFTLVDVPKAVNGTLLEDINSAGEIVGFYFDDAFNHHAFSYHNGQVTALDPPGLVLAIAFGVDDLGRVTGEAEDLHGFFHAWIFDGTFHNAELGSGTVAAWDINNQGWTTVVWQDAPPLSRSSLYHDGKLTDINVPGAISSAAHGINSAGDVVFSWTDDAFIDHGALLSGRRFTRFDAPGCDTTSANRVNDSHVIVGTCSASGVIKGFYVSY
jgi:probable HAF family extracellular repeat protein